MSTCMLCLVWPAPLYPVLLPPFAIASVIKLDCTVLQLFADDPDVFRMQVWLICFALSKLLVISPVFLHAIERSITLQLYNIIELGILF